jgi:hypothetical protein
MSPRSRCFEIHLPVYAGSCLGNRIYQESDSREGVVTYV